MATELEMWGIITLWCYLMKATTNRKYSIISHIFPVSPMATKWQQPAWIKDKPAHALVLFILFANLDYFEPEDRQCVCTRKAKVRRNSSHDVHTKPGSYVIPPKQTELLKWRVCIYIHEHVYTHMYVSTSCQGE